MRAMYVMDVSVIHINFAWVHLTRSAISGELYGQLDKPPCGQEALVWDIW